MLISFYENNAAAYIGLINTLAQFCDVKVWGANKSIYDMMDELQPDFAVWKNADCKHNGDKLKKEFPNTKIVILDDNQPELAANIFSFPPQHYPEFSSDLLIIGSSLSDIDVISPLLNAGLCVKIIGQQPFSVPNYVGKTSNYESIQFIDSAKVVLTFSPQSELNIFARGTYAVSPISQFDNNSCGLYETILNLVENDDRRLHQLKPIQEHVLHNTYYHRALEFTQMLGLENISKELQIEIEKIWLSY